VRREIFAQPLALRGSGVASARRRTLAVEDYDVPRAEFVAVITFAWIASGFAEILEVRGSASGMEFVIAGRRTGAILQATPGFVVACKICRCAIRVSEITDGHHSARNFVEQGCGGLRSGKVLAIGDVACSDQHRGVFRFGRDSTGGTTLQAHDAKQSPEKEKWHCKRN